MPVQFVCSHCHRTLSVAQRKAGTSVTCPKCGQPTFVPAPSIATITADAGPSRSLLLSEPAAFDDIPVLISETAAPFAPPPASSPEASIGLVDTPLVAPAAPAPPPPPPPPPWPSSVSAPSIETGESIAPLASQAAAKRRAPQPEGSVLLITRQAVYAQAALTGGLVLLAFLLGLFFGRGNPPTTKTTSTETTTAAEPVALDGHILYALSPGESLPDAGATVIALPAGKKPNRRIAAGDAGDLEEAPAADALLAAGAAVARANSHGQFQLVVSRPGDYSLLIISHHSKTPDDQTAALADQEVLAGYFASPGELIGQNRYTIVSRRLSGSPPAMTHEFGPTDKK